MSQQLVPAELEEAVRRFEVCWEATPELSVSGGERSEIGFVLELYGTHDRRDIVPTAGCKHCIPVLEGLLSIADFIVPDKWRGAVHSLRAHSSIEYATERGGRPDVVVTVRMIPRDAAGSSSLSAECFADVTERLGLLGACERSWRPQSA